MSRLGKVFTSRGLDDRFQGDFDGISPVFTRAWKLDILYRSTHHVADFSRATSSSRHSAKYPEAACGVRPVPEKRLSVASTESLWFGSARRRGTGPEQARPLIGALMQGRGSRVLGRGACSG
jgi:hypothetical protein